jgi:deoxyribonuclease-4
MRLGAHESVAGGLHLALTRATDDGCEAVQIFTKNSSTWKEPALDDAKILAFRKAAETFGAAYIASHTSYLINLAAATEELREKSIESLANEVRRCSALGIPYAVLHPGAHLGDGEAVGISRVAASLDEVHRRTEGASAKILLENTAGQGTCIGHEWSHLRDILAAVKDATRLACCFDTQHAYAAGNDLATVEGYEKTFEKVQEAIGLSRIVAFHLNDSKKALGSRVDRHENLGKGLLGEAVFRRLVQDARFAEIPAVLETAPAEGKFPYRDEVALLKSFRTDPSVV